MTSPQRIALILGAGPRIGAAVAQRFAAEGYRVAIASRSGSAHSDKSILSLKADFSRPGSVADVFAAVQKEFNVGPSVVVYNAATLTPPPAQGDVFSISVDSVEGDLVVNSVSSYAAAQAAVKAWEGMNGAGGKTFIYTGNYLNTKVPPVPFMTTLGMGKSAAAYWIGVADAAYRDKGYRFFYADERKADGSSPGQNIDGEGHAEFYASLARQEGDVPWQATFVTGKGYVKF
ncbi:hypothetical protein ANO11243_094750 [Dothideomycetidae sp. 11243]|nr:hypothetical protein ANO11243_094750 [fungal sp. No.11243]